MELSKEQKQAVEHIHGPALVLAVPGAGKTTVLIQRTVNLILNHKISPERILSITFSRASARDMKERFLKNHSNISTIPVHFSTIHSFCFSLIREYAYLSRINFTLIEDEQNRMNKYALLKKIYFDINNEYITEEKLETLLNSIGYMKNIMFNVEDYIKLNKPEIENFKTIYELYEKYKRDNKLIDFDDMLTLSLEILLSNKYLLEKYKQKYDFIQVDEGQDTSKVQLEIIKLLAQPKNNLFIVADDDQSIYGFRGAYPKGLLNFKKTYNDGKIFFMEENYRSSKNIVSVCNKFIKRNTMRYNKNIKTSNDYVEPINIVKVDDTTSQYSVLIDEIKNTDLSKSCILFRNNISSIGLVEVLERNNIPFYMRDTKVKFFNHWLLKDILSFLYFSKDTSKMSIYENIYYKKRGYISKKMINYASLQNYTRCVFDRIMDFPDITNYYKSTLRELKSDFKRLSDMNPYDGINFIQYNLEYDKYLKENSIKFGYTYDNLKSILYYLKLIASKTKTLEDFINRLKFLEHLSRNSRDNKNGITLSTVHSAKGLEYDRVYMIDLADGDFPTSTSIEEAEKGKYELLEEERRLFYVGMSRAKYHLSLFTMNSIGEKKVEPSRFLEEL